MHRILIISHFDVSKSSAHQSALGQFKLAFNEEYSQYDVDYCSVHELIFKVDGDTQQILRDGKDLQTSYDVIAIRNMNFFLDYAAALARYASYNGVKLINETDLQIPAYGKVSQAFLFSHEGIPTPPTISATSNATLHQYVTKADLPYPIIVKHNDGIMGINNYLVRSSEELRIVLEGDKQGFVVQPFIENDGELRVLTFGTETPIVFKKKASGDSHLNNTAQGSAVEQLAIDAVDPVLMAVAHKAAAATGRDIGGVDILLANDGRHYVLEVNHTAALASGVLLSDKRHAFAAYVNTLLKDAS